ncbi:glycosyltransferase [Leucobacter denitrificans]|uniref:Glycosyltransferase n=1 Tax=Leucobacter denitrificans TaxID=683042 RepID=A0A7G9S2X5_9MICO|nr:glycosyltransferase [Leucobacter denitrificans]QNN62200.1 glycosyltransferase [Leucobacter denitrificans]
MRIALVSMHTSPVAAPGSGDAGGMNVVVSEAARALAARGHDVVMVTRETSELRAGEYPVSDKYLATGERTASAGILAVPGSVTLHVLPAGDPALRKEQLPDVVSEFAQGLRALGKFDAVHAHYWLSGVAALEAFGVAGGSTNPPHLTFHTLGAQKNARLAPGDSPEPLVRLEAELELTQRCFVIAASASELDAVEQYCESPRIGSAVVHPGVDTSLFRPRPPFQPQPLAQPQPTRSTSAPLAVEESTDPAHTPGSPLRITVLGRVQPLKGQDLAIRAMGEFARTYPELAASTELVIAGEPTPGAEAYANNLRELCAEYSILDRVRFLPAQTREQAAELLASSALVLVPSHSETFGLTALEAGASGVPILAGGHTGLVEAAPDGVAGVHLADRDPHNWGRGIAALIADPHRRAALGQSARHHAEQHNWAAHAEALERIYARH